MTRPSPSDIGATAAALAGTIALAALWHALGLASRPTQSGYPLSQYLAGCASWPFALAFVLLSGMLGWTFTRPRAVAIGMLAPLPVAVVIEMVQDSTSHNLIPIEIILYWLPTFLLALAGALLGQRVRRRQEAAGIGARAA